MVSLFQGCSNTPSCHLNLACTAPALGLSVSRYAGLNSAQILTVRRHTPNPSSICQSKHCKRQRQPGKPHLRSILYTYSILNMSDQRAVLSSSSIVGLPEPETRRIAFSTPELCSFSRGTGYSQIFGETDQRSLREGYMGPEARIWLFSPAHGRPNNVLYVLFSNNALWK